MQLSLGTKSILLFMLSVIFLILLTLFEASLADLSLATEKIVSTLLLVVPAVIGLMFGVMGMARKEANRWVAIIGILLNTLFALFFIFLLSFAG